MTGQLNFDFRSDAGTAKGRGRHKSDPRVPKAGAAKVRAEVRRHPRVARTAADERHIRELKSQIWRLWRPGPAAPSTPDMMLYGIRHRAKLMAEHGRQGKAI